MDFTFAPSQRRLPGASSFDPHEILMRVRRVLPEFQGDVGLHEPRFHGREREYVLDCIDSTWVSYSGAYVTRFEAALAERSGATAAVAVSNGTVALQLCLQLVGVERDDEVLVPALTFVATANAVIHAGGIPHFIDVDDTTFGVDAIKLRSYLESIAMRRGADCINRSTGRRIAALLPVHVFGHPVDMDELNRVADEFGLKVVEDAAEALGSRYKGRACGSLAPLAALSFNGNKVVTTGGGGAILTSDPTLAERARKLTTTAKRPHRWALVHDEVAYNFRLPNINAALGLAQLERLDEVLAAKKRLWSRYRDAFEDMQGVTVFRDAPFAESNHWLIALVLDEPNSRLLEGILGALNDAGIRARPAWTPMHQLPMYGANPRMPLPVTEALAARIINLPSSPFLAPEA
jgi:perosamine synthetase